MMGIVFSICSLAVARFRKRGITGRWSEAEKPDWLAGRDNAILRV